LEKAESKSSYHSLSRTFLVALYSVAADIADAAGGAKACETNRWTEVVGHHRLAAQKISAQVLLVVVGKDGCDDCLQLRVR
jgi:hypothetical protein